MFIVIHKNKHTHTHTLSIYPDHFVLLSIPLDWRFTGLMGARTLQPNDQIQGHKLMTSRTQCRPCCGVATTYCDRVKHRLQKDRIIILMQKLDRGSLWNKDRWWWLRSVCGGGCVWGVGGSYKRTTTATDRFCGLEMKLNNSVVVIQVIQPFRVKLWKCFKSQWLLRYQRRLTAEPASQKPKTALWIIWYTL
jgi:hypothetical protein